jgi:hypothetical protein
VRSFSEKISEALFNLSEQILLAPNLIQRGFLIKSLLLEQKEKKKLDPSVRGADYWSNNVLEHFILVGEGGECFPC